MPLISPSSNRRHINEPYFRTMSNWAKENKVKNPDSELLEEDGQT